MFIKRYAGDGSAEKTPARSDGSDAPPPGVKSASSVPVAPLTGGGPDPKLSSARQAGVLHDPVRPSRGGRGKTQGYTAFEHGSLCVLLDGFGLTERWLV